MLVAGRALLARQQPMRYTSAMLRGRHGFDAGRKARGACRGHSLPRKTGCKLKIVANDDNYALAA